MSAPRIDQINLVLADVVAAADFLTRLGVPPTTDGSEWDSHHRGVPTADARFEIELDSSAFARHWGGLPADFSGVVVNVRVDDRTEVDRLYALALANGADGLREPYDAFWGSRFATVQAPGPMVLGLLSERDMARASMPPAIEDFA